mmetsp:Transcript_9883/g.36188  ORF Transcript_9883/g.36188 Transcript_9883/m.36188 type:complete len:559 (+) Transcript_9883:249-1925(+)
MTLFTYGFSLAVAIAKATAQLGDMRDEGVPSLTDEYHSDNPHDVKQLTKEEMQESLINSLQAHKLQIMLLGDSLIEGFHSPCGWRGHFYQALLERNLDPATFDFVGQREQCGVVPEGYCLQWPCTMLPSSHYRHEGQPAWTIQAATTGLSQPVIGYHGWDQVMQEPVLPSNGGPFPHIIFVMLGTNNLVQRKVEDLDVALFNLMIEIHNKRPEAQLLLSPTPPLTPWAWPGPDAAVNADIFNRAIGEWVYPELVKLGIPVTLVNSTKDFELSDLWQDGFHIGPTGNDKIGNAVADAVVDLLNSGKIPGVVGPQTPAPPEAPGEPPVCTATCGGFTCDFWVALDYSCDNLETSFACDCSGCLCSVLYGNTSDSRLESPGVALVPPPPAPRPEEPACSLDNPEVAAICGKIEPICGTSGGDTIYGTSGRDCILAYDGDDVVYGMNGNDIIVGGRGRDTLFGGRGKDMMYGEDGEDTLYGQAGDDYLDGGEQDDVLFGGKNTDRILGEEGNDMLVAGKGKDILEGGPGADTIFTCGKKASVVGEQDMDTILKGKNVPECKV